MENYICINGKKAELTEEQLKKLGIELPKKNPFERVVNNANTFCNYYFIGSTGNVNKIHDAPYRDGSGPNDQRFRIANYCTDKSLMEQRALHETMCRLLWRFSMTHKAKEKDFHEIYYDRNTGGWKTLWVEPDINHIGAPRFDTEEIAQNAIDAIVLPFMEAHPEFKL